MSKVEFVIVCEGCGDRAPTSAQNEWGPRGKLWHDAWGKTSNLFYCPNCQSKFKIKRGKYSWLRSTYIKATHEKVSESE